ncbi:MAG: acetate/propionate family kinase [bacterium]|nr:acetate/propionate family kinase [bacterium]
MKVFVINCGSSSLKYDLMDMEQGRALLSGKFTSIGSGSSGDAPASHSYRIGEESKKETVKIESHADALELLNGFLNEKGFITGEGPLFEGIGHRVVHGGEQFCEAIKIDEEVKRAIQELIPLAPLHNPVNLKGIELCEKYFPGLPQVAVFDTAFHQTLPKKAYLYGTPMEWYENYKIRRYGFHGSSHKYTALKAAEYLGRPLNQLKLITCHLGNGASVCAINYGNSVDTSMGLSPLEGLIMGTRSGDIDPVIIQYLVSKEGMDINEVMNILNRKSGLLGISGYSSDMQDLAEKASEGDERSVLAIKMFVLRVIKIIGAYLAELDGADAIVFTGGIGENSALIRERVSHNMEFAGAIIDEDANNAVSGINQNGLADISVRHSRIKLLVVNTDEEWMIAHDTKNVILGRSTLPPEQIPIPMGISARHIHLSVEDVDSLFGKGHKLTPIYDLSQPGQFVCDETVSVIGPKGTVERVRVLGPPRSETQVEISRTDEFKLGIDAPIRASGKLDGTPGLTIVGPEGRLELDQGVICALRHIHMTPSDALSLQVDDKDLVRVRVQGPRELIFGDVLVRVSNKYRLEMHIDTDEANAAELSPDAVGFIMGIQNTKDIHG